MRVVYDGFDTEEVFPGERNVERFMRAALEKQNSPQARAKYP
jgi:DNA-binding phage protein